MDARLTELYLQRGRLQERIRVQRGQVARELAPIGEALHAVDRARALLHQARLWMVANPGVVAAVAVAVVVWRPRAVLRAARWGFSAWRSWSRWQNWVRAGLSSL
jgi:hypothetical protein